jgi:hypothetical protein
LDRLVDQFGEERVFADVDTIRPGDDFADVIAQAITSCEVLLAIIGRSWLAAADPEGYRRLDNPNDYVRLEIETAFHNDIPVIPILVDGARFPNPTDLPAGLTPLSRRQALSINKDTFRQDVSRLIDVLKNTILANERYGRDLSPIEKPTFVVPRDRIFVSYNHQDQYWLDRLLIHLRPLERQGRMELWSDRQIRAGDEWREEIKRAIEYCHAAILLVSADFMASDFIHNNELAPLLEAAKNRGVRVIPLLVSSSSYEDSDLNRFQSINAPSEPLDMLDRGIQEAYFVKVYRSVRDALL